MPSKPPVPDIVKRLRDLAEKATPGPYRAKDRHHPDHSIDEWWIHAEGKLEIAVAYNDEDQAYFASLDPATMLQLLDVVDAAQACVDSVKSEWCGRVADEFGGHEDDWASWWDDSKAVAMFTALRQLKEQS